MKSNFLYKIIRLYIPLLIIISTFFFISSCNESQKKMSRYRSVDEEYDIMRDIEKKTGMFQGVCTNKEHVFKNIDYCIEYKGPLEKFGKCSHCGCSRYDHWGELGLDDEDDNYETNNNKATFLNVSNNYLSFKAESSQKTLTVDCDGEWIVDEVTESWIETEKSGNKLIITVDENSFAEERDGFVRLTADDCQTCIDIKQVGAQSAYIKEVWLEHNQYVQNYKGMIIHCHLYIDNMKGKRVAVGAFFFDENENQLKGYSSNFKTTDGYSCTGTYVTPDYENAEYKDFKLFMPYFEFNHILKDKSNDLKVAVGALTTDGVRLHSSEFVEFNYNK